MVVSRGYKVSVEEIGGVQSVKLTNDTLRKKKAEIP